MAGVDPIAFLRSTPPFDGLPQPLFDAAASKLEVVFFPSGSRLVHVGGEPLQHLYVIRRGSVRLEREGQTLQVLEDGETFGYTSLITHEATLDVVVEDELLAYRIPGAEFERLLADARFAGHFAVGLAERLKSSLAQSPVDSLQADLSLPVDQLVHRTAVWVDAGATVREAAQTMHRERVSSALVRGEPPGIVTDRDFRSRVLAKGLGPDTPVKRVASVPVRSVGAGTPVHQAWRTLLDGGFHHLGITRGDDLVAVVSSSDLLKYSARGPMAVLARVERLADRDSLPGYARRVSEMTSSLLSGGLDVAEIAGFVARLNDALLRRILSWAEADLGPPPAPYAWMALGSEGRMEQTLLTDQDNALVYADAGARRREWFELLAARVNEDLEAAGYPRCPGGYMATRWHATVSEWVGRLGEWIDSPGTPQALLDAAIFSDFRRAAGDLDLAPLESALARAAGKPLFLRFLAKAALNFRPPASLLLRLRGESSSVDLKLHGITPIALLARCYAFETARRARGTVERLEAATRAGLLDSRTAGNAAEAYRFLLALRLRLQLRATAEGDPASSTVALGELTGIERTRLKDAFRAIKTLQDSAVRHFKVDF